LSPFLVGGQLSAVSLSQIRKVRSESLRVSVVGAGARSIFAVSKPIVSWMVGNRNLETVEIFMQDVRDRLANPIQLTTDGHRAYLTTLPWAPLQCFRFPRSFGPVLAMAGQRRLMIFRTSKKILEK
jgi:hypothetical protein